MSSRHVDLDVAGEDDVDVELDETMAQTLIVVVDACGLTMTGL